MLNDLFLVVGGEASEFGMGERVVVVGMGLVDLTAITLQDGS